MESLAKSAPSLVAAGLGLAFVAAGAPAFAQSGPAAPSAREACSSDPASARSPRNLQACFYEASVRASRAARHLVSFATRTDATAETARAFADAATVASNSLVGMAGRAAGRSALAQITSVVVTTGKAPTATVSGGVLTVTIVPAGGVAGRPSSRAIERAAEAAYAGVS